MVGVLPERGLIDELNTNQQGVTVPFAVNHLSQHIPWLEGIQRQIRAFRFMAFPRSLWAMWGLLAGSYEESAVAGLMFDAKAADATFAAIGKVLHPKLGEPEARSDRVKKDLRAARSLAAGSYGFIARG